MRYRITCRYLSGAFVIRTDQQVPVQVSYPARMGDSGTIEPHPWKRDVLRLKPDAIEIDYVPL